MCNNQTLAFSVSKHANFRNNFNEIFNYYSANKSLEKVNSFIKIELKRHRIKSASSIIIMLQLKFCSVFILSRHRLKKSCNFWKGKWEDQLCLEETNFGS